MVASRWGTGLTVIATSAWSDDQAGIGRLGTVIAVTVALAAISFLAAALTGNLDFPQRADCYANFEDRDYASAVRFDQLMGEAGYETSGVHGHPSGRSPVSSVEVSIDLATHDEAVALEQTIRRVLHTLPGGYLQTCIERRWIGD
jgi:hypothetical protein